MKEQAFAYLGAGLSILPLVYGQKTPAVPEITPYFSKPPTVSEVDAWFAQPGAHNIAIVTGLVSRLVVIDIDANDAFNLFLETVKQVPALNEKIFKTFIVRTGKGVHIYLRFSIDEFPEGIETTVLANTENGEVRVKGNRGYVVAPPSLHPSGKVYESNKAPFEDLTKADWDALLKAFETTEAEQIPISEMFAPEFKITAGNNRHEAVLRICSSLIIRLARIMSEDEIMKIAIDWNDRHCDPPINAVDFARQWVESKEFASKVGVMDAPKTPRKPKEKAPHRPRPEAVPKKTESESSRVI